MPVAGAAGSPGGAHPHRAVLWSFPHAAAAAQVSGVDVRAAGQLGSFPHCPP